MTESERPEYRIMAGNWDEDDTLASALSTKQKDDKLLQDRKVHEQESASRRNSESPSPSLIEHKTTQSPDPERTLSPPQRIMRFHNRRSDRANATSAGMVGR